MLFADVQIFVVIELGIYLLLHLHVVLVVLLVLDLFPHQVISQFVYLRLQSQVLLM